MFSVRALPLILKIRVHVGLGLAGLLPSSTHGPPDWVIPDGVLDESINWCGFFELLVTV